VLLRDHRDLESARAFPARATGHRACRRAIREHAPAAVHTVTGLHRAPGHATAQPIERSHVPVKDRRRPMRGRQALETGQRLPRWRGRAGAAT
jgi:transposase-like protein